MCIGNESERLARAFVFINAEPRREVEVLRTLRKTKYVKEPLMLYGAYDLVVIIEARTVEDLYEIARTRIKRIDGVQFATAIDD